MRVRHSITCMAAFVLVSWAAAVPANATWSIVGVDEETGAVGLAAATCGTSIQYIAALVPGKGVAAAQAATSFKGRDAAEKWIAEGASASEILENLSDPDFYSMFYNKKFPTLQYGVATLGKTPDAGFVSGDGLIAWSGGITEDAPASSWSVQGNTLRGAESVEAAATAMALRFDGPCRLTLSERLMRALEAGRDAGGDKRCPTDAPALSALLYVANPDDDAKTETRLVAPRHINASQALWDMLVGAKLPPDAMEPVAHLRKKWRDAGQQKCLPENEIEN